MKTIVPPINIVDKIYQRQDRKDGVAYIRSHFCLSLSCEDGTLLYHTLTGEMVLLGLDEAEDASNEQLIRHRFYVPEGFDEYKHTQQIRSAASMLKKEKSRSSFLIPTTTDCNARCYYCFELGTKRLGMTAETAKDAASYMIRVSGEEELKITWFGGEPLYNRQAIDCICAELKKAGKPFRSVMISNGYYLDEETARTAVRDWNLDLVQITLDGTKEIYQLTKAYVERDTNAFDRVIENIRRASEAGIAIHIRLNMDARNADDLYRLTDELKERLNGCRKITAWCELLREYTGRIGRFSSEEEAAETCIRLQQKLDAQWPRKKEGLPRSMVANCCIADNDSCETILPDGTVGKCDRIDYRDTIGDIWSADVDMDEVNAWKERVTFPECRTCPMFPQCIILKRCKGMKKGCSKAVRIRSRWEIEEKMRTEYERYKNESR